MSENNKKAIWAEVHIEFIYQRASSEKYKNNENPTEKPFMAYGAVIKDITSYDPELKMNIRDRCFDEHFRPILGTNVGLIETLHTEEDMLMDYYAAFFYMVSDITGRLREFYDSNDNQNSDGTKKIKGFNLIFAGDSFLDKIYRTLCFSISTYRDIGWKKYKPETDGSMTFEDIHESKLAIYQRLFENVYPGVPVYIPETEVELNRESLKLRTLKSGSNIPAGVRLFSYFQRRFDNYFYKDQPREFFDRDNETLAGPLKNMVSMKKYEFLNPNNLRDIPSSDEEDLPI